MCRGPSLLRTPRFTQSTSGTCRPRKPRRRRGPGRLGDRMERIWAQGEVLSSPGLLVGAQTAHGAVPGATADTGIRRREAADSTEGALGPGRGSRTGRQIVGALGHAQVLQRQGKAPHLLHPPMWQKPTQDKDLCSSILPWGALPAPGATPLHLLL